MVRHIVSWTFKEGFTPEEKAANALRIKEGLEGLRELVPGILELTVRTELLPGSNVDLVLDSLFESAEALDAYQIHPEHVSQGALVKQCLENRRCIDFAAE